MRSIRQTIEADGLQTLENWWWILCGGKSDHELRFRSNLSDFWGWWTLAFHKHAKQLDLYVRRIEAQDGFCVVASGSKEELLDLGSWGHGATNWNTSLCVCAVRFQQTVHVGVICCCLPVVFHKLCSDLCETKGAFSSWPDETTPFPVCWGRDCWHPCGTSAAGRSAICYLLCRWCCCDVFFLVCPACVWDIKGTFETLVWFAGLQFRLLLRDCFWDHAVIRCNLGVRHVCAFTCSRDSAWEETSTGGAGWQTSKNMPWVSCSELSANPVWQACAA